ncbi:MAG: hypothetical protein ACRDHD_10245 [Candidatus Limnocylindria bacterium]
MLHDIYALRHPSREEPRPAGRDRLDASAARLNTWLRWRPERVAPPPVLSVAELAECRCPEICNRDHGND